MKEGFQLRECINSKEVNMLAVQIYKTWKKFDKKRFSNSINPHLDKLNFGERIQLVRKSLKTFLPDDFKTAAKILIQSLGPEIKDPELAGFEGFLIMSQTAYVARYGLDHFDLSMKAFYEMTKRFSAEGSIRYFIQKHPDKTLKILDTWSNDKNVHVRRLVSECTRPRLPLMFKLQEFVDDPTPALKLLEKLKNDSELYVRRSVANNLNDISKDNPEIVIKTLKKWSKSKDQNMKWIVTHALRTLVKQGNHGALEILGYPKNLQIKVSIPKLSSKIIKMGEHLVVDFRVKSLSDKKQNLMVDYIIHHMKSNSKTSPKVFKLGKKILPAKGELLISKKHLFKPISTRKYYSGKHFIELQINGKKYHKKSFELKM